MSLSQCLICQHSQLESIPYPGKNQSDQLHFREILICSQCGHGTAGPARDQAELDDFYENGTYWDGSVNPELMAHNNIQAQFRVQLAARSFSKEHPIRVLDIGAGFGQTGLWLQKQMGDQLNYYTVEPDPGLQKHIKSQLSYSYGGNFKSLEDVKGLYDLIFLNHVLEHVADPRDFLSKVINLLSKKGKLYVETPNRDYRFKDNVFPHTQFFSPKSFGLLGKSLKVTTDHIKTFGDHFPDQNIWKRRILSRLFRWSIRLSLPPIQRLVNHMMWRYRHNHSQGIWLRWLISHK